MQRHIKVDERAYTFEELSEMTRSSPRRSVDMMRDALEFNQLGEFNLSKYWNLLTEQSSGQEEILTKLLSSSFEFFIAIRLHSSTIIAIIKYLIMFCLANDRLRKLHQIYNLIMDKRCKICLQFVRHMSIEFQMPTKTIM